MKARKPWDEQTVDPSMLFIRVDVMDSVISTHGGQQWRDEAACASAGVDHEWFFGDSSLDAVLNTRRARGVCAGCPVKRPCLEFALRHDASGIWAGTTQKQRRATAELSEHDRIDVLLELGRIHTTTGQWRSATPGQWRHTG